MPTAAMPVSSQMISAHVGISADGFGELVAKEPKLMPGVREAMARNAIERARITENVEKE